MFVSLALYSHFACSRSQNIGVVHQRQGVNHFLTLVNEADGFHVEPMILIQPCFQVCHLMPSFDLEQNPDSLQHIAVYSL